VRRVAQQNAAWLRSAQNRPWAIQMQARGMPARPPR
jgi:hypothetical protein